MKASVANTFVFLGACSYGLLATLVKIGYSMGLSVYEITLLQYITGFVGLTLVLLFTKNFRWTRTSVPLILAGTTLGTTGIFYYLSLEYTSVATGIILLMQSTWMGIVWESFKEKEWPHWRQLISLILILLGTYLSVRGEIQLEPVGVLFGLLAALSYTITIQYSGLDPQGHSPVSRTWTLMIGGFFVVFSTFWLFGFSDSQIRNNSLTYEALGLGALLGFLGTFLAPLLFSVGRPHTSLGTATLLSSVELPVSVFSAFILLSEPISTLQITGILSLLLGVISIPRNR
jgi:drug/metabolite transporter (DMT)-like permease